jgi:hypothetical protein
VHGDGVWRGDRRVKNIRRIIGCAPRLLVSPVRWLTFHPHYSSSSVCSQPEKPANTRSLCQQENALHLFLPCIQGSVTSDMPQHIPSPHLHDLLLCQQFTLLAYCPSIAPDKYLPVAPNDTPALPLSALLIRLFSRVVLKKRTRCRGGRRCQSSVTAGCCNAGMVRWRVGDPCDGDDGDGDIELERPYLDDDVSEEPRAIVQPPGTCVMGIHWGLAVERGLVTHPGGVVMRGNSDDRLEKECFSFNLSRIHGNT